jgi:hypothetical protein
MAMSIVKSRDNRLAFAINHLSIRTFKSAHVVFAAHCQNSFALDGDHFRASYFWIERYNVGVMDDEVCGVI